MSAPDDPGETAVQRPDGADAPVEAAEAVEEDVLVDPAAAVDDAAVSVEPSARQRLRRARLHPGSGQIVAALLLAVLGVAAVTQFRLAGTDDEYAGMRQADLIQALNGLQASTRRTEQDIGDLEATRDALRSNHDKTATALAQARNDLAVLGVLAWLAWSIWR